MTLPKSLTILLSAVALASCDKNAVQDITGPAPAARVRFFNFGVNAPAVNFHAGATKLTAITSATGTESVLGVAYGGVGSAGFYAGLAPGPYVFAGKIAAAVDKDLAIATASVTLVDGKNYSFYMSGIYDATAKTVDAFVVEDAFVPTIDYSVAYVRFVNAISNSVPMSMAAQNTVTAAVVPIGAAVAYRSGGEFIAVPGGIYDVSARAVGGTVNLITRTALSFAPGRVYTVSSRGDMTVTSTTATTRPILDISANR